MSLLTSIFGTSSDGGGGDTSTTANEKEKQTTSDLFANSISVPPALPPPRDSAAAASSNKRKVSFATASDETASNQDNNNNTDEDERTVFVGNLPIQTTRKDLLKLFASCGPIQSTRIRNVPIVSPETGNTNNSNHKPIKIAQAGRPGIVQKIKVNTADESMLDTRYQASVQGYVVFASTDSIPNALQLHNTPFTLTMNRRLNKKKKNANNDEYEDQEEEEDTGTSTTTTPPTTSTITRHIRVDRVSGQKEYDAKRSVFIGNLPYHADEEMLRIALLQHSKGIVVDDNDKVDNDNKESDDSQQQQPNDSSDPSSSSSSSSSSSVIQGIRIIRDATTHQCKGFGYVLLQNKSQVSYALQHWNNIMYENRPLRVRVCGTRFKSLNHNNNNNSTATKRTRFNHHDKSLSSSSSKKATSSSVAASLRQMMTTTSQQQQKRAQDQKKRKRGPKNKKGLASSSSTNSNGSKRAVAAKKTQKRIHKIEKRIRHGMGKMRAK